MAVRPRGVSALRRLDRAGLLDERRATQARTALGRLRVVRHEHGPLHDRIWELRGKPTVYDASYVALAERLRMPLVTCDAGIAGAPGHDAVVELFGAGD